MMMNNPAIQIGDNKIYSGHNLDILRTFDDNSVDSIVTDPPYELGFMSKTWDSTGIAYSVELWQECLRVLKPGGHLLAFGGSRTWHRLAVAIEDAGFEMRDSIAWLYGSGFPKSHNISKAIDKLHGAEREVIGKHPNSASSLGNQLNMDGGKAQEDFMLTAPATDDAKAWDGWGTALKPAFEPIVVARKPLVGTVAENVLQFGTGGLNIDASRIGTNAGWSYPNGAGGNSFSVGKDPDGKRTEPVESVAGRWPANVILDETTAQLLDEQTGASRFFYVAKASKRDRNEGLDELPVKHNGKMMRPGNNTQERASAGFERFETLPSQNFHPTVKPTTLMTYLIKLVTPEAGVVLDPFAGSGSTGKAAILEGYKFVGIELTADYLPIIEGRLQHAYQTYLDKGDDLFA